MTLEELHEATISICEWCWLGQHYKCASSWCECEHKTTPIGCTDPSEIEVVEVFE